MFSSKLLLVFLVVLCVATAGLGYSMVNHHTSVTSPAHAAGVPAYHPKADTAEAATAPTKSASGTPLTKALLQNAPGIVIDTTPGSVFGNDMKVTGKAGLASGQLGYRIKGESSGQLAKGVVKVSTNAGSPAAFSFPPSFEHAPSTDDIGIIELYDVQHETTVAMVQVRLK